MPGMVLVGGVVLVIHGILVTGVTGVTRLIGMGVMVVVPAGIACHGLVFVNSFIAVCIRSVMRVMCLFCHTIIPLKVQCNVLPLLLYRRIAVLE